MVYYFYSPGLFRNFSILLAKIIILIKTFTNKEDCSMLNIIKVSINETDKIFGEQTM